MNRYFAINCLVGQELFITPPIRLICKKSSLLAETFTGADGKKYMSVIMHEGPRWCEMKYNKCRCKFSSKIESSQLHRHFDSALCAVLYSKI